MYKYGPIHTPDVSFTSIIGEKVSSLCLSIYDNQALEVHLRNAETSENFELAIICRDELLRRKESKNHNI